MMMTSSTMADVITPAYQPIVDLRTGEALYFEALARATTQQNHVRLLQFAEEYGFIHLLDVAMIEHAAHALAAHPRLRIGVNVSVATIEQFTGPLVSAFFKVLPLAPRFVVEITETVQIRDRAAVRTFIQALKAAGAKVAFDDIGDGHFTLADIDQFRPHIVKLAAKLFAQRRERAEELQSVLAVARESGLQVVAEEIDSEEKRRDCQVLGISFAQGFLVGGLAPSPGIVAGSAMLDYAAARVGGRRVVIGSPGIAARTS